MTVPSGPKSESAVAPAWSDNMGLTELNRAIAASSTSVAASTQANSDQRFWSTPARPATSPVKEVMEISLTTMRLINRIDFQAVKYPHDIYVEFYDEQLKSWASVIDAKSGTRALRESVVESVPGVIPPANAITGHLHPQHSFSGHWQDFTIDIRPTYLKRLRLVLVRTTQGAPPRNTLGQLIDYSLGVNNFRLGYQVKSKSDVPRTSPSPGSFTEYEPFAATSDIFGSGVNYSVRVNKAQNILRNGSGTNKNKLVWKSEPQPFPWAVVNFYVDTRDADGQPQVIDRFYLEPLTDGANLNLYYSNDEPTSDFESGDDPLGANVAVITGPSGKSDVLGQDTYGQQNYVTIDNTVVGFNPGQPWWLGAELTFNFTGATDNSNHPIIDCGAFSLAMTPLGLRFSSASQDVLTLDPQGFSSAGRYRFALWYDGTVVRLMTLVNNDTVAGERLLSVPLPDATIEKIRVGGFLGQFPGSGSFRLHSMVLKVNKTPTVDDMATYLLDPTPYAIKPGLRTDDDGRTDNAILRYDPASSNPDFPSGFIGGPPDHYAEMEWSPIARDYILRKGFLYLPPTKAKYWKLEFCNLVPQPYEVYVPVKRTVKTYTKEMWTRRPTILGTIYASLSLFLPGLNSVMRLAASASYRDQPGVTMQPNPTGAGNPTTYSKTMVRIVNDFSVQLRLGSAFWGWNFMAWHRDTWCPKFERVTVHTYTTMTVEQKSKIAYFVGLQKVEAYRLDYLSVDDTAQFVEMFHDLRNISPESNWVLTDDHQLTSGPAKFAQVESKPIATNKMIRGVQFAATQSDPTQVLSDHDFDDPTHEYWSPVGDGYIVGTQEVATLGSVLRVDRSPHPMNWGALQTSPGTWGAFESRGLTYRLLEQMGNPAESKGGVESPLRDTPPGGRVHVAARAIAPKDLTHPLFVQIVDQSDRVVAEAGATVRAGQVAEWYASYTIGEGGRILAHRWGDFTDPPAYANFVDSFDHVNSPVLQLMDSGQAWIPATSGSTVLSHAIVSNDAVQNASATAVDAYVSDTVWGGIDFVVGTMGTGAQVPLVIFEPFTLTDAGTLSFLGGFASTLPAAVFGRALVAGDAVHIDIMPTKFVPSARRDVGQAIDDISAPYSLVFYLNGVWTSTFSHRLGARPRHAIQGRAGQRIRSYSFTPANYARPPASTIWRLPAAGFGGSLDSIGSTWTDPDQNTWAKIGSWDTAGLRLSALSTGAEFRIETRSWLGVLHARVHNIATGNAANPNKHGNLLILDSANGVYIDAYGYVMQNGMAYTRLFPNGIPADSNISVQFADAKQVSYTVRGSVDAAATPRMLIGRINGVIVGVWASTKLNEWNGTIRGLAGDPYNNGVDSDGNPVALPVGNTGDLCTSFDMFDFAPDTSTVALDPGAPTWEDVSKRGTATFAQVAKGQLLEPNRFRARLVQKGQSNDVWEIDTLSMFVEPIVWYFSNDGGQNFFPAYDIRNNPRGVLTFPAQDPTQPFNPNYGQQLVWRAVSYAPDTSISGLVIRPWYAGLISGVTHRVGMFAGDPNVMPYDHYPDLEKDARFQTWNLPIPQEWWYQSRILERSKDQPVSQEEMLLLPEGFIADGGVS